MTEISFYCLINWGRALEVLVGTGGWDYFDTTEEDRLRAYARHFRFVEVNSTFYHIPRLKTVRSWRRRVPRDFVFSVKCNRVATHEYGLRPVEETFRALEWMSMVCRLLRSEMLVLQTPTSLKVDEDKIHEVSTILKNTNLERIQVFWEAGTHWNAGTLHKMEREMIDEGIIPVVDLSKEKPISDSKMVYSRLFSHGSPWFNDETIEKIRNRVSESRAERVALAFHGSSMYRDAARYIEFSREKGYNS